MDFPKTAGHCAALLYKQTRRFMLFNSLTFVVFFVVVVALYWSIRSWKARKNLLVVASYIFYGAWNPPFAALLFSTTSMDFWLGARMAKAATHDQNDAGSWPACA